MLILLHLLCPIPGHVHSYQFLSIDNKWFHFKDAHSSHQKKSKRRCFVWLFFFCYWSAGGVPSTFRGAKLCLGIQHHPIEYRELLSGDNNIELN